jgi:4-hydroxy-3-methylbut-2-enyl diphosphate reductase
MTRLAEAFIDKPLVPEPVKYPFHVREVVVAGDLGPCGGVRMALMVTQEILNEVNGRETVYANNPPVHNTLITAAFEKQGLKIEPDIDKVPSKSILILSAHGTNPEIIEEARKKGILVVNVECTYITKVRREKERTQKEEGHLLYIGAVGHPEPKAVLGNLDELVDTTFISDKTDLSTVKLPSDKPIRVLNQTTLSTKGIIDMVADLRVLNPGILIPDPRGICYATDNRQNSLYGIFSDASRPVDFLVVVGSQVSHNSEELRAIGARYLGDEQAKLVDSPKDINPEWFTNTTRRVAITSGASVPDAYTIDVIEWFRSRGSNLTLTFLQGEEDAPRYNDLTFQPPHQDIEAVRKHLYEKYTT